MESGGGSPGWSLSDIALKMGITQECPSHDSHQPGGGSLPAENPPAEVCLRGAPPGAVHLRTNPSQMPGDQVGRAVALLPAAAPQAGHRRH